MAAVYAGQKNLMSQYDFQLCSTEDDLLTAYRLRMRVFHDEQGFPADTEVDEYDSISAHFLLRSREDGAAVATVRLTPYPRKPWLKDVPSAVKSDPLPSPGITQNESSLVTSAGGPEGSAGGLPMFSPSDKQGAEVVTKSKGAPAEAAGDEDARKRLPLGRPLSNDELQQRFIKTFRSKEPIDEEIGAPQVRGAKVSRLAVSQDHRGLGLGKTVMEKVEGWLMGFEKQTGKPDNVEPTRIDVVISSQMHAKPFYEKLGYAVYGEPYDEEGAPHCWCVKSLR